MTAVQIAEQVVSDVRDLEDVLSLNGTKGYKKIGNYIEDKNTYDHFVVTVTEKDIPVIRPDLPTKSLVMKKALISIKAKPGFGINEPEFKTEMYLKVQP